MAKVKGDLLAPLEPPAVPAPVAGLQFERLAMDPNVNVEKLERLIAMQERIFAREALEAYTIAMADAQTEMRPVATDADNPSTRSRYASYAALDRALRPIYTRHGFALSFNTEDSPHQESVRVLCYLSHRAGHERTFHVDMPADGKGAKGGDVMTKTHAAGAAMSYGMRYLLKMVFNVAVGEDDTDGNLVLERPKPDVPDGYQDWLDDITAVSDEGTPALMKAWNASRKDFRGYLTATARPTWDALKERAKRVGAAS